MAVVSGRPVDRPPFMADLSHWYDENTKNATIPPPYQGLDILGVHKAVGAGLNCGAGLCHTEQRDLATVTTDESHRKTVTRTTTYKTPHGDLRTIEKMIPTAASWHIMEHPIKGIEDFKAYEWVIRDQIRTPTPWGYKQAAEYVGDHGIVSTWLGWAPLQQLMLGLMGQEQAVYALHDYPKETEAFMAFLDESDDERFDIVCDSEVQFVWLANHIDGLMVSPTLFQKYCMPYYQKRTEQLHKHGKTCVSHYDGRLKGIMPMLKDTGVDVIEAITPLPMGDISLEEIKRHKGDLVVWGGMFASIFCPPYTEQDVLDHLFRWLDAVGERGVVAMGDDVPPNGDIEKVRVISEALEQM